MDGMRSIAGKGLLALAGLALSIGAGAQDRPAGTEPVLEEIVVTASRREEVLQDVAAAVVAIDPEQLAAGGIDSLTGALRYVPGVNFNNEGAPGQGSITMRGVGNMFPTASVGIYVDDVPYGSVTSFAEGANFALDAMLTDLERIEVIKGPQGTLFGASSMGGSLRYITRDPSLTDMSGNFAVDLSDTSGGGFNELYKGGIGVPIVEDRLAFSVSGFYKENEGFIDEETRPLEDVNDSELRGATATLLFQATDALDLKLNHVDQKFEFANANEVPFDLATGEPIYGRYVKNSPLDSPTEIDFELTSLTAEYGADWGTVTFVSSYQEFMQSAIQDLSVGLGPLVDDLLDDPVGTNSVILDHDLSTERWAHELRLTSAGNDRYEWLAGLYYTEEESANFQGTDVSPGELDLVTQIFPSDYSELAAFGNFTWFFADDFDATLGLRLSRNETGVSFSGTGVLAGPELPHTSVEDDVATYLLNLRYRPSDDLSLYTRIANGYRPASANLSLVDPITGEILSVPFVEADTLWSYEIGAKGSTRGGTLRYEVAAYHLKWQDLQVFRSFMNVNVGGNADSDVTVNGLEATLEIQPMQDLTLAGSAAWTSSELDDDDPSLGGLEGEQLPRIPEWTLSLTGNYDFRIGNNLDAFVAGGVNYKDDYKANFQGNGTTIVPANPNVDISSYTTVDLRTGIDFGRYRVSLYATNLLDEYGYQNATTNTVQGTATVLRPRTVGLVLAADF